MAVQLKQLMTAHSLKTPEVCSGVVKMSCVVSAKSPNIMTWTKLKLKDKTAFDT